MNTALIKQQLHLFIDSLEDEKAEAMYTLMKDMLYAETKRRILVQEERERYLKGSSSRYTLEQVKDMAMNKNLRPDEF